MRKKILLILFVFSIARFYAIDSNFTTYSVVDGLSNSSIKAIYQDKQGFIWFGTKDGLNRFDGNEFRIYRFDSKKNNAAFNNDITCFAPDKSGNLWIGTFDGVVLFNPFNEQFFDFEKEGINLGLISGVVTEIYVDKAQHVWISTKKGLYMIDSKTLEIKVLLKNAHVSSLNEYIPGNLLIDVKGKGIALVNTKSYTIRYLSANSDSHRQAFTKIYKDHKGQIWLGASTNSFFLFSPKDNSVIPVNITNSDGLVFNNEQIHCINELNDSTLILGTDKGLIVLNQKKLYCKDNQYNTSGTILLKDDRIMSLSQDRQGGLWVGTFNKGVKYFNPYRNKFNYYNLKIDPEIPVGIVGSIIENDGKLWIGHEKGLSSMDMKTGISKYYNIQSLVSRNKRNNESYFIFKKDNDQLCFYLLNNGLFTLDLKSMRILNRIDIPPTSQVRSMMRDKDGKIWIAEEDLSIYDPLNFSVNNNLESNNRLFTKFTLTQDLLRLSNGNMLVGTRTKGVFQYIFENSTSPKYNKIEFLPIKELENKNITALFEDSKKRIWIGTYGFGLFCYEIKTKKLQIYNEANGLCNNLIFGILEDNASGDIWASTVKGLSKIEAKTKKIKNYTIKTGFPLSEVSLHSFLKASNGYFYIGGINGIASFNPHLFVENPYIPNVQITAVQSLAGEGKTKKINIKAQSSLQHIILKYSDSFFQIKFSALNYLFPKENKYAYKLQGFDKDWIITDRNDATYTNLTEGDYIFCIKACNNDGIWNEKVTTLAITVLPPFWRTWWAKVFYLVLFVSLLYLIIQYLIIRNTYKYQLQIDRIEKENIEKNYQMKISLFTNFSHELRTPLTLIVGPIAEILHDLELPAKFQYPVQLVNKNVNRLLLLVNQLMDFRKIEYGAMKLQVENVDVNKFISELVDSFEDFSQKRQIKILYSCEYEGKNIWFDVVLFEKVIFNLVSNALKVSTSGNQIKIKVYQENQTLIFSVTDYGSGIASEDIDKVFDPFYQVSQGNNSGMFGSGIGLNLSKDIVTLHKGNIWAKSILGKETTFYVRLMLGNQHFENKQFLNQEIFKQDLLTKNLEKNSMLYVEPEQLSKPLNNNTLVLIVEDDPDLRQYIKFQLNSDYTIIEAEDGEKGFEIAKEKLPDLIVSDIMMPIVSGIELCDQIKTDMRTAHIPVVLLTARVMNTQIQEGYEHGADDYILKPFDTTLLKARVQNLIESRLKLRKLFGQKFSLPDTEITEISTNDKLMQKLIEIIQNNIANSEFCIDDISGDMGMSRAQLYRKIKSMTDLTPNNLIMQIRMKMAISLFKTNNYNISDVAYQVGFSDPAYFSKYFKSVYKMTPTEYVNQLK